VIALALRVDCWPFAFVVQEIGGGVDGNFAYVVKILKVGIFGKWLAINEQKSIYKKRA
jgi:hypothetical protein